MAPTRRLTARAKLTLLYGGVVVVAGGVLLTAVLVLLDRVIETQPIVVDGPAVERALNAGGTSGADPGSDREIKQEFDRTSAAVRTELRARTLTPLIGPSLIALGVLGVAGFGTGWFVAGRVLRPIRTITATAGAVAADGQLGLRIAPEGPHDEIRELAETFDAMLDRLDRSFAAQRAFVGNASHELRTPVATARTMIDVAIGDADASPDLLQLGRQLLQVNVRQERLIEGLLALARAGHVDEDRHPVDLARIASGVVEAAREEAGARSVTVGMTTPALEQGPWLRAHPALIERLVENLVQNGVRHNVAGGWVHVELSFEDARACLRVTNSGPVIPQTEIDRLFEPFRRSHDRVGGDEGAGLGLSIVKAVAVAHDAAVRARPREGGGLVVDVTFHACSSGPAPARRVKRTGTRTGTDSASS